MILVYVMIGWPVSWKSYQGRLTALTRMFNRQKRVPWTDHQRVHRLMFHFKDESLSLSHNPICPRRGLVTRAGIELCRSMCKNRCESYMLHEHYGGKKK